MSDNSTEIQIGSIGEISHITGMLAIGGDVVAGDKTVIQYIIQQAAKKLLSQPYKFLSAYDLSDQDIFFGREALIEQLAAKVPRHKVLLINGASGSGKSSLINAGLIPRLADNGYTYLSFRDYSNPLHQLQDYLVKTGIFPTAGLQVELLSQIAQAFKRQQLQVVFIFDQFERFFVNVPSAARLQFIEMIKSCLENLQPAEMNVIFSMREEFFGQFQREFEKVIRAFLNECERINLEPLNKAEAREAILKPLQLIAAKIGYDRTFVDEVLLAGLEAETGEQKGINPPHLQIVCNQLYQVAYEDYLKHQDLVVIDAKLYQQLGGVQTILRTYLDDCVNTVAGNSAAHIQVLRALLKQMIETIGMRKFVTAAQLKTALSEVSPQEVEIFLQHLQDARVIEVRPQAPSYSLSHEFMVEKVKDWYDEREMERKKAEETLEHGLAEWQNSGTLLSEKQVLAIRTFLKELNEPAQQLLLESEKINRARQRAMRLLRASLVVFVLLSIGFGIFSYFKAGEAKQNAQEAQVKAEEAIKERKRAEQQAQTSKLRQLGAQAILATKAPDGVNGNFDRALLLAVQAFKEQSNVETQGTLLRVVSDIDDKNHHKITAFLHHSGSVRNIAFSPDGKTLASGSYDNTVILWDIKTHQPLGSPLQGHSDKVTSVAFSPDGQTLASGSADKSVILWEVKTHQLLGSPLQGHDGRVRSVAFSADGQTLASGSDDKTIILWEVKTLQPIGSPLQGHREGVMSVAFSADGKTLASSSFDETIILWDVKTHQPIGSALQGHSNIVISVAFSPDGQTLASGSQDKTVILWDVKTHQSIGLPLQGHRDIVTSVAFSADGQTLASGSVDKTIILWNVKTHQPIGSPLQGHSSSVESVAFSADSKMLASGSDDKTIILWEVKTRQSLGSPLPGQPDGVTSVAFSPDGQTLASGSYDKTIILWEVKTHQSIGSPLQGHRKSVTSVAFSPDGQTLASGSQDKTVILWDVKTHQSIGSPLQGHSHNVTSVAFSPDGQTLASGSQDKTVILWDVKTHQSIGSPLQGHSIGVFSVAFSPDGQTLASGSVDKTVILWDVKTHQPLGSPLQGHRKGVMSVAFSADGKTLASGSFDETIILWDVKTHQPIRSALQGHSSLVASVAFSPNGKMLASGGSYDKTVILWDVKTHQPIGSPLPGHSSSVESVAFSPDGKTLASGSNDKTVILWDIDPQSWYQRACRIANRNLTQEEWQRYLPGEPYQKACPQFPSGEAIALLAEGEQLAATAEPKDIEAAIAKFNEAFTLDPMLKEHPLYAFNPETKAKKIAASAFISKGKSLAGEEKLDKAMAAFKRAQELDGSLQFDPQTKANQSLASALISKGESLAEKEKLDEAIAAFKRAQELDGNLRFDPQTKANQSLASVLIDKGASLAQEGKLDEAIAAFKRAQELDANLKIHANSWNALCWYGSLSGQATKVLESCETAVKLSNEQDAEIRNNRGLARALTGNFKDAISDFQFFVQHASRPYLKESKKQRQEWIKALKKGKNPFTEEVLKSLR